MWGGGAAQLTYGGQAPPQAQKSPPLIQRSQAEQQETRSPQESPACCREEQEEPERLGSAARQDAVCSPSSGPEPPPQVRFRSVLERDSDCQFFCVFRSLPAPPQPLLPATSQDPALYAQPTAAECSPPRPAAAAG